MTNREYAELLDYVNEKANEIDNVSVYRVHSSHDPKANKISKVVLKMNYTKDGKPLPDNISGKLPKNVIERSVQFRGLECNKDLIKEWIDDFIDEKRIG